MMWWLSFLIAFVASLCATRLVMAVGIADLPDESRKIHKKVTPTSGGLGIMAGVACGLGFWLVAWRYSASPDLVFCFALAVLGGVLGLVDDIKALGSKRKLFIMLIGAALFVVFGTRIETLFLTPDLRLSLGPIIGSLGTVLWLLVIVNTVNFMDGANGMAMGCSALALFGLYVLFGLSWVAYNTAPLEALAWVACSACAGFLVWNSPIGRIFAGDSGSLFIGLLSGGLGSVAVVSGVSPFSVALCFLPMLVDVILTIVLRLRRKQNILKAHSDHVYQASIKAGDSHLQTSRRYWVATFLGVCMAISGQVMGEWWSFGLFWVYTLILCILYFRTYLAISAQPSADVSH